MVGRADVKRGCLNVLMDKKLGGQMGSKGGQEAGVYGGRQQGQGGRGQGEVETHLVYRKPRGHQ